MSQERPSTSILKNYVHQKPGMLLGPKKASTNPVDLKLPASSCHGRGWQQSWSTPGHLETWKSSCCSYPRGVFFIFQPWRENTESVGYFITQAQALPDSPGHALGRKHVSSQQTLFRTKTFCNNPIKPGKNTATLGKAHFLTPNHLFWAHDIFVAPEFWAKTDGVFQSSGHRPDSTQRLSSLAAKRWRMFSAETNRISSKILKKCLQIFSLKFIKRPTSQKRKEHLRLDPPLRISWQLPHRQVRSMEHVSWRVCSLLGDKYVESRENKKTCVCQTHPKYSVT